MVHSFVYLDYFLSFTWVFPSLIVVSSLPCHFLNNRSVMGFILVEI